MGVFDLHLHSKYSADAVSQPSQIVKKALSAGLAGFAITDHNTAASFKEFKKLKKELANPKNNPKKSKNSNSEFLIIFGEEVKIVEDGKARGEILCYFLSEKINPGSMGEILDWCRQQDALTSIAHPFDIYRKPFRKNLEAEYKKVNAVEAWNGRSYQKKFNLQSAEFVKAKDFPLTAGSDSHSISEIRKIGFECGAASEEELRKAILKKKGTVCAGSPTFAPWQWAVSAGGRILPK